MIVDLTKLVKPLVWRVDARWPDAPFSHGYQISPEGDDEYFLTMPSGNTCAGSMDFVTKAANADHASRVLAALDQELLRELVGALSFYADPAGYETQYEALPCGCCTDITGGQCELDAGDQARATLAKLEAV